MNLALKYALHQDAKGNVIGFGLISEGLTREKARAARDWERPAYRALQERIKVLNAAIYVNGNYNPTLTLEQRVTLLSELSALSSVITVLARRDKAFNDIISYRADAEVDPDNWEAVDRQEWKKELAFAAQVFLAKSGGAA